MYTPTLLTEIASFFGLTLTRMRPEIDIAGSPQRCDYRTIVEDDHGDLFIMENIGFQVVEHKRRIARLLERLAAQSMPAIAPYRRTATDEHLFEHRGTYWQLQCYLPGIAVPRPAWTQQAWRGDAIAGFVADLRRYTARVPSYDGLQPFDMLRFIRDLQRRLALRHPRLQRAIEPLADYVLMQCQAIAPPLPTVFCHGDLHPLNIIWGENDIRAVIDWEFAGWKTEVYDLANLIGCAGVEDPLALSGAFVSGLLSSARELSLLTPDGWQALHPFVLATRFAWLSEWLRAGDVEMIQLEQDYMHLLWRERNTLQQSWAK